MLVHESNLDNKIRTNYNGLEQELKDFKNNIYLPMRARIESIDLSLGGNSFNELTNILNIYWKQLHQFANKYRIKSQSKFESTFLEEISYYLFHELDEIKNGKLSIYNKRIYAGLKMNEDYSISVLTKDVDFCIGKKVTIIIEDQKPEELIIPAVSVEVKTYLDATMFGEIKSSSKTLKSATPNSHAYVLIGYKSIADTHIIAARQDATLDEIFVLQKDKDAKIDSKTLQDYYKEIYTIISQLDSPEPVITPGRLLKLGTIQLKGNL